MSNWIKPLSGRISSKFGNRLHPVTKQPDRFHNGVDVAVPRGTQVVAPRDGKVIKTFFHEFGGHTIWIAHGKSFETRYCHLDKILVKEGQEVKQGDLIAESGNTGRSSGPHLHFGIRDEKGNYLDPQTLITF